MHIPLSALSAYSERKLQNSVANKTNLTTREKQQQKVTPAQWDEKFGTIVKANALACIATLPHCAGELPPVTAAGFKFEHNKLSN